MSAWTVIAHREVPSAQQDIEFANIPQTYDDLLLVLSTRTTSPTTGGAVIRINGVDTNRTRRTLNGDGSSATSNTDASDFRSVESGATASTFSSYEAYFPNYRGSTNKSYLVTGVTENNATGANQQIIAGLWSVTDAITNLTLRGNSGTDFAQYSSATLYGITKGSSGGVSVS